ncbi:MULTISPECIES: NAD(P)/FAD-dependent oxidoreductase [unclassified Coleofasciculus]|uniref:NAD(P)/FAD-dependent oxidoreductase n=1 Tax=unclassified Coleofasciculus TaxID=2692782 RepID=UPI00187EFC99|nr:MULTISPECIES: FAD-binding oxidoreductase [unclassified Coleofasciculus]MBE9124627.1 FAD-binding oxidoreductase [Coleofasciculus sp. LEGE 07081]MBE9147591.1 FAD-binding oxidoreductase [Coleofasciculus sp. LEGE 07092]
MKIYDWIVVGGGITGAALGYELRQKGFSVLIIEQDATFQGATRYSYGGLAYWSATSELTRVLCAEGIERHRTLSAELDTDTEFRELDLVLTIAADRNPEEVATAYQNFAIPPTLLTVEEACKLEPLLNPNAIAGALTVRHGHINPERTTQGYLQAFHRAGGELEFAPVVELLQKGNCIQGVKTTNQIYHAANTVICAGGLSRALLQATGIHVHVYFTHAEMIETPKVDLMLRTLVMPATMQRFQLEDKASTLEVDPLWDEPGHEPVPPILDAGAIQFLDGSLRMGQISRVLTDPNARIDSVKSEAAIRTSVGNILPTLENLPGTWHHCLVAFSSNSLPLVGILPGVEGAYLFSGFTNPLVFVPPLAQHFANWVAGQEDKIVPQLSPTG